MKRSSTIFLQIVIVFIGIVALALLLWEPRIEGRNVNATNFEIYFKDPFLALVYVGSIPFFVALYQSHQLLTNISKNKAFSAQSVRAFRNIKLCNYLFN